MSSVAKNSGDPNPLEYSHDIPQAPMRQGAGRTLADPTGVHPPPENVDMEQADGTSDAPSDSVSSVGRKRGRRARKDQEAAKRAKLGGPNVEARVQAELAAATGTVQASKTATQAGYAPISGKPEAEAQLTVDSGEAGTEEPSAQSPSNVSARTSEVEGDVSAGEKNASLVAKLRELAKNERAGGQKSKATMLVRAANLLTKASAPEVKSMEDVREIRGMGKAALDKIEELLTATKPVEPPAMPREYPRDAAILQLKKFYKIGDGLAAKLIDELGIDSVEKLTLPQNAHLLASIQNISPAIAEELEAPIPRQQLAMLEKYLSELVKEVNPQLMVTIGGSYRRGEEFCSECDVSVVLPDTLLVPDADFGNVLLTRIVKLLKERGLVVDDIGRNECKYMGIIKPSAVLDLGEPPSDLPADSIEAKAFTAQHRRLDLRGAPAKSAPFGLLYFTGPPAFVAKVQQQAREKGFALSAFAVHKATEEGKPTGDPIPCATEKDIFKLIGMNYVPPEERAKMC